MHEGMEHDEYRPSLLLDECLAKYGLDKHRSSSKEQKVVAYVCMEEPGVFGNERRWLLGGISESHAESLASAFSETLRVMRESHEKGMGVARACAYSVVTHGVGTCSFINTTTNEPCEYEELPPGDRDLIDREAQHDLHKKVRVGDELPTRIVNIITPSGLAADISIWLDGEVFVERAEEWVFDGKGTIPGGNGALDDALMGTLTFATLVQQALVMDYPLTPNGLMKVAFETSNDPSLSAHLMRVIATGMEVGLLNSDDLAD